MSRLFRKKHISALIAESERPDSGGVRLQKRLTVVDLTVFGIAAIVGSGIFSTIGIAAYHGGPAVVLLFIGVGVACAFTGLAYAEFASIVPVSGSAYTYSYIAFGEFPAWLIGWALIMEYSIGNISVAISFSDYFTDLMRSAFHWNIPEWASTDYFSASQGFQIISGALSNGKTLNEVSALADYARWMEGYYAWIKAPLIGNFHLIMDLPALSITFLMTWVVYRGVEETRRSGRAMVAFKLMIVLLVIVAGAFFIDLQHWRPFMPNGMHGVLQGVSAVFFAYIGFDAISTTTEECINPQRDIPRAIIYCLIVCTVLYIIVAAVLTGVVSYKELNVGDPPAYIFTKYPSMRWLAALVSLGGVVAIAGIFLVYILGQPRIWMVMGRDGLLPPAFSKLHPRFRTPYIATIVSGCLVAVPTLFLNINFVTDVSSLSTLFAFALVCAGCLRLRNDASFQERSFKSPYFNAGVLTPIAFIAYILYYLYDFIRTDVVIDKMDASFVANMIFMVVFGIATWKSVVNKWSFIPIAGFLCCFYMMIQLDWKNWLCFFIWLALGLCIYFGYSVRHSKLNLPAT